MRKPKLDPVEAAQRPNKQLFANSPLSEMQPENDFFNPKEPNLVVNHEKTQHRTMIWMKMQGMSNREIAHQLGFSEPWVSQVLRQPWAREIMAQEINKAGDNGLVNLLRSESPNSVFTLVKLRDDDGVPSNVRRQAAIDIINCYLPKPKQVVQINKDMEEKSDEELLDILKGRSN